MEYSNADLSVGQTDLSYVELPKICISVYKEIVKIFFTPFLSGETYRLSPGEQIFLPEIWHICIRKRVGRFAWNGSPILNGKRNWTVYISDAGIMRLCWHIPKRMLDRI